MSSIDVHTPATPDDPGARVLFIVSGATYWVLKDGTRYATGYWAEEFANPYRILTDAGHEVVVATPNGVTPNVDMMSLRPEMAGGVEGALKLEAIIRSAEAMRRPLQLSDVRLEEYDAVYLPGGHGPMADLAWDADCGGLLTAQLLSGRPLFIVCHAPAAMLSTRIHGISPFKGYRVTCFTNEEEEAVGVAPSAPWLLETDLREKVGVAFSRGPIWEPYMVEDRNLVTGQNPHSATVLAERMLEVLAQRTASLSSPEDDLGPTGMGRRVAIITGASHGIGAALVAAFREGGYAVVANARSIAPSDATLCATVAGDVADPRTAERVIGEAVRRFGRIDTLVNNAGIFVSKPFPECTSQDFDRVTAVNLRGFFEMTSRALPVMLGRRAGHVVSITTTLVEHADARVPSFLAAVTKGGVAAATRSLATEFAMTGIRVNAVSPGVIRTSTEDPQGYAPLGRLHPMGRVGEVDDVVRAIMYLESAPFVTGEFLHVDGGQSAGH